MKKIVIVMTYFERQEQLNKTLRSIVKSGYANYEIVVVDDGSQYFPYIYEMNKKITVLHTERKVWTNPEPAYNIGIYYAMLQSPDIIILQNAECYHVNDILFYANQHLRDDNYISFSCFSIDKQNTFANHDITALLQAHEYGASMDGQVAWYNHPRYRPVGYDFCSAISAENMRKLNGYDERLSDGCGYGDDYLLQRIKMLGLKVQIPEPPAPFVVHQWHYNTKTPDNKSQLVEKNRILYHELLKENNYKAVHKYTTDLL